jgi:hypothetical protein
MLLALGICLCAGWMIEFYAGHSIISDLSFPATDPSYIPPDTHSPPAFGVHYFGDFEIIATFGRSIYGPYVPGPVPQAYGPLAYVIAKTLVLVGSWPGGVFLFLGVTTVLFVLAVRCLLGSTASALLVALLCVFTGPMIIALDRGNFEVLLAVCFVLYAFAYLTDRRWMLILSLAIAVAIKAYVALLILTLVRERRWRDIGLVVIVSSGIYAVCFFILGGGIAQTLPAFIHGNISYESNAQQGSILLGTVSAAGGIFKMIYLLSGSSHFADFIGHQSTFVIQLPGLIALLICVAIVALGSDGERRTQRELVLVAALATTQLVPAATYPYAAVAMVVELCVLIRYLDRVVREPTPSEPVSPRVATACIVLLVLGCAPSMGYSQAAGPSGVPFYEWYLQVLNYHYLAPITSVSTICLILAAQLRHRRRLLRRSHDDRSFAAIPGI